MVLCTQMGEGSLGLCVYLSLGVPVDEERGAQSRLAWLSAQVCVLVGGCNEE
jgi:hypothetical protein